jgi:Protein of unknown function (DUF1698)
MSTPSYEAAAPSKQTAVDLFRGEWISALPEGLQSGGLPLFNDPRIDWLAEHVDLVGRSVLELGPLEGGHSHMLERLGAERIVAVEGNRKAFLKCLVVKEVLGLRRVEFLYGDLVEYLRQTQDSFDVCVASGVLYHMADPTEMLRLAARVSNRLFLWTHYYDAALVRANPQAAAHFPSDEGPPFRYVYDDRNTPQFAGGSERHSNWLDRTTIVNLLRELGFDRLEFAFEQPDHPNGPALAALAARSPDR